jgi:hypothetical protein
MQATIQAHRIETTLQQDGTLTLDHLPFQAGEPVEVIILPHRALAARKNLYPLRGTSIRYDSPLEPIAVDDWNAIR